MNFSESSSYLKVKIDGLPTCNFGRSVKGPKFNQYTNIFAAYFTMVETRGNLG